MNTLNKVVLPAALAVSLISCGGMDNKDNAKSASKTDSTSAAAVTNKVAAAMDTKTGANAYAERLKARRAKGDTLALPFADLEKFLPQSVDGYTAGKPNGASVNMGQMSYSTADITFKKDNGDMVKVTVLDYNQAYQIYSAASAAWSMGMSIDSPSEKAESVKLDNTDGGWETYKKNSKQATITVGIGNRFFVKTEATNQADVEMVKSITKSMDLSKLSAL